MLQQHNKILDLRYRRTSYKLLWYLNLIIMVQQIFLSYLRVNELCFLLNYNILNFVSWLFPAAQYYLLLRGCKYCCFYSRIIRKSAAILTVWLFQLWHSLQNILILILTITLLQRFQQDSKEDICYPYLA